MLARTAAADAASCACAGAGGWVGKVPSSLILDCEGLTERRK